jgi:pyridoxal phosphate enzyme (YggS family)
MDNGIAANLLAVKGRIAEAAQAAGRAPEAVALVAVSKTKPAEAILAAIAAGQRIFGENRIQEAEDKWPAIKAAHPGVALHLVGPLQRNKVRRAVALFDVIESVDRERLAAALAEEMAAGGRRLGCFVQVNTGEEPQKAGVPPADVDAFVAACRDRFGLDVRGLMCIPPVDEEPSLHFALLAEMARRNGLAQLSMGMSDDFEVAVRFGATHVRVGTAIFGGRPPLGPATG